MYTKSHRHYHNHHLRHVNSLYDCFFFIIIISNHIRTKRADDIKSIVITGGIRTKRKTKKPHISKTPIIHACKTCVLLFPREIRDRVKKNCRSYRCIQPTPRKTYTARTQIYTPKCLYHQQLKSKTPACDTMNNCAIYTRFTPYSSSCPPTTDAFFV